MSSGVPQDPAAARGALGGMADSLIPTAVTERDHDALAARRAQLDCLWRAYSCETYNACTVDWSGAQYVGQTERDMVATQGFLPPGFYDAGATNLPLKYRRPTAPHYLARRIVNKLTSLLFGKNKHPSIRVPGDPDEEDYTNALAEAGRMWPAWSRARTKGGAMGVGCVGFKLVEGRPVFEVFDPRECEPVFVDSTSFELRHLEIRRTITRTVPDQKTGQPVNIYFLYRRFIDDETDMEWKAVQVADPRDEPQWEFIKPDDLTYHGLGEVPAVWVQNTPRDDQIDGDPDCHGCYENIEAADRLFSQANSGVINNSDPTVHVATDGELSDLKKGSDNAIKTEVGGSASYMEMDGKGPEAATKLAKMFEDRVCSFVGVALDGEHKQPGVKTATEVDRDYSSQWETTATLQEQYGECGIKPLIHKAMKLVRRVLTVRTKREDGKVERMSVLLPKRKVEQPNGSVVYVERKLGKESGEYELHWPPNNKPTLNDLQLAVKAANDALTGKIIDAETASRYVASYFDVEDVRDMRRRIEQEGLPKEDAYAHEIAVRSNMKPEAERDHFFAYEIEDGICTIDEVRATHDLGPLSGGDGSLTVPQYKAKHPEIYAAAAQADAGNTGAEHTNSILGGQPKEE